MSAKLSLCPRPSKDVLDKYNPPIPGMGKEEGYILGVEVPSIVKSRIIGIQQRTGNSAHERMGWVLFSSRITADLSHPEIHVMKTGKTYMNWMHKVVAYHKNLIASLVVNPIWEYYTGQSVSNDKGEPIDGVTQFTHHKSIVSLDNKWFKTDKTSATPDFKTARVTDMDSEFGIMAIAGEGSKPPKRARWVEVHWEPYDGFYILNENIETVRDGILWWNTNRHNLKMQYVKKEDGKLYMDIPYETVSMQEAFKANKEQLEHYLGFFNKITDPKTKVLAALRNMVSGGGLADPSFYHYPTNSVEKEVVNLMKKTVMDYFGSRGRIWERLRTARTLNMFSQAMLDKQNINQLGSMTIPSDVVEGMMVSEYGHVRSALYNIWADPEVMDGLDREGKPILPEYDFWKDRIHESITFAKERYDKFIHELADVGRVSPATEFDTPYAAMSIYGIMNHAVDENTGKFRSRDEFISEVDDDDNLKYAIDQFEGDTTNYGNEKMFKSASDMYDWLLMQVEFAEILLKKPESLAPSMTYFSIQEPLGEAKEEPEIDHLLRSRDATQVLSGLKNQIHSVL